MKTYNSSSISNDIRHKLTDLLSNNKVPFTRMHPRVSHQNSLAMFDHYFDQTPQLQAVTIDSGERLNGVAMIRELEWESKMLRSKLASIDYFVTTSPHLAGTLLDSTERFLCDNGYHHAFCRIAASDHVLVQQLQNHAWTSFWPQFNMASTISAKGTEAPEPAMDGFSVRNFSEADYDPLKTILADIPPFTFLSAYPKFVFPNGRPYETILFEATIENPGQKLLKVLLYDGNPVGFNASQLFTDYYGLPESSYSKERLTFISPNIKPHLLVSKNNQKGYGVFFQEQILNDLSERVRYSTGNVRRDATRMLTLLYSCGYNAINAETIFIKELSR